MNNSMVFKPPSAIKELEVSDSELPPPPRSAPAARSFTSETSSLRGQRDDLMPLGTLDSLWKSTTSTSEVSKYDLDVQTGDAEWKRLSFTEEDELSETVSAFLKWNKLHHFIHAGLKEKMQKMLTSGRMTDSVDVVDLL